MQGIFAGVRSSVTIALTFILVLVLARTAAAQNAGAQNQPLNFGDNFFVTGDYVFAGAYGMTSHLANGFATGTISFPDTANKGIKGPTSVPEGAQIVAALLYWQTVEKVGQTGAGQNGFFRPVFANGPATGYPITGVNVTNHHTVSFSSGGCSGTSTGKILQTYRAEVRAFLPQDANGNVIINNNNPNPVFKNLSFEVRLPSVGNNTPLTLGATLVLIYRVLDPGVPLNSIVIYDGAFAPTSSSPMMTQTVQGFYDALVAAGSTSSVAHIAGSGQSNKFQTVSFNGTPLSSLYGKSQPAFPGWYGTWDNVRWNFPDVGPNPLTTGQASVQTQIVASTTMPAGCVSSAAVIVSTTVENTDGDGLLNSWKSNHGYCDASFNEGGTWTTQPSCTSAGSQWVDLTGAVLGSTQIPSAPHPDVFLQLDYMCYSKKGADNCDTSTHFANSLNAASAASAGNTTYTGSGVFSPPFPLNTFVTISGFTKTPTGFAAPPNNGNFIVVDCAGSQTVVNNVVSCTGPNLVVNNPNGTDESNASATATFNYYSFDPRQVTDSLTGANSFAEVNTAYTNKGITLHPEWHAMAETPGCTDTVVSGIPSYCPYLNQPGLVGWKGGFDVLKGQPLNLNADGTNWTEAQCEASPTTCVRRFQHGQKDSYHEVILAHAQGGPEWSFQTGTLTTGALCPNATMCVAQSNNTVTVYTLTPHGLVATHDQNPLARVTVSDAITNTMLNGTYLVQSVPSPTSFTIQVTFAANVEYTPLTDPRLSVASGRIHTRSGFSDVGGGDSLVTLGRWDPVLMQQVTGTTFMHEIGHANGLTHGGYYYDGRIQNPNDYRPTVEPNCKPNFQSVMNYPFQLNHLDTGSFKVVDYSEEQLDKLNEQSLPAGVTINLNAPLIYPNTLWYTPTQPSANTSAAKLTCDGFPVPQGTTMYLDSGSADPIVPPWATNQDIDFNLKVDTELRGHNDWTNGLTNGLAISPGLDLRQVGATGADASGGGGSLGPGGGSLGPGGGSLGPGGGSLGPGGGSLGPGGGSLGPGGGSLGPGGGSLGPGGGSLGPGGGVGEVDFATATAVTYPPSDLMATEGASPRTITLNWTPGFGLTGFYKIYRSNDGGQTFNVIGTVNAPTTTFTDNPACNPTGYQYHVSAVQSSSSPNPGQESGPSNTVFKGQVGQLLTGCYISTPNAAPTITLPGFISPAAGATFTPSDAVNISWTFLDASNNQNFNVATLSNPGPTANKALLLIGPLPSPSHDNSCTPLVSVPVYLLSPGSYTGANPFATVTPLSGITANNGQFTATWNTGESTAGCYVIELDADTGQYERVEVQLLIDVTDTDNTPHVTTTAIPNGVVGTFYSNTISEDGGVIGQNPFAWILANGSNPLPPGLSLGTAPDGVSGLLSGIPSAAGMFSFVVQVTDSVGNIGTQTLTMTVTTPVAQINQPLLPDSSLPGAAAFVLTLNGTGFGPGSQVLWNGSPLVTTFISNRQLTAAIPGSDVAAPGTASVSISNPVTISNKPVPSSNIDFFQITPLTSASLSRTDYATGQSPNGLIAADFNGDGKADLATANSADGTVTILLGNGDGTFTAQPNLNTGAGSVPNSLTAGDFNGDGKLDLAVADFAANNVSVFLGNGNGTFQAAVTYAVANGPFFVITGDFNRDGMLDLAVANQNGQFVSILLGNGDGTFQPHVDYAAGGTAGLMAVAAVALGDFNRDGKLDLAVTNPSNGAVSILLGNGDGTFQAPVAYSTGNAGDHPLAVSAVALRGTGILDLAVTNVNANTVAILLGNGDGTFQPKTVYNTTSSASAGPGAITTGDFNGDGQVDLAITNQSANTVSILLGNGDGTLQNPLESTTGTFAAGVAAADFNGDGRLDVAVADLNANTVSVMLQRPEPASNLAVTGATASQVSLTWTASASTTVVGYNVYRGTTQGGPYTKVNLATVAASTFTDITVASGTTYYYVVTAVDPGNLESVNSNEVSATTPPQPATSLSVANVTASQVSLSWTASNTSSVVNYNVYRGTMLGGPYQPIGSTGSGATTTFTDTSVQPNTTYYYVVTAVGPGNVESVNSNEVSASTPTGP